MLSEQQRLETLERTVDIISHHLLLTSELLDGLIDNAINGDSDLNTIKAANQRSIQLLRQVRRLSKH